MLLKKLGEKESKLVLQIVESYISRDLSKTSDLLATKADLANARADILKWMFVFWIGMLGSFLGNLKLIGVF
ncbi:MAG: hypothetical protein AAF789_07435 [Bacteroidota bacterium]